MEKTIIAANWKSNKTKNEAKNWLEKISLKDFSSSLEIIVFPPFTLLDFVSDFVKSNKLPISVGAQNVSPFEMGPYTGEISASQLREFVSYVLIGHSERRSHFGETNSLVRQKTERVISEGLTPIVCAYELSQLEDVVKSEIVVAYEPLEAIGSGRPENPAVVNDFGKRLREKFNWPVLYGGSISPDNIKSYLNLENISGLLVGGQSLDENSFMRIIENAS